jgi:hypothetical protein
LSAHDCTHLYWDGRAHLALAILDCSTGTTARVPRKPFVRRVGVVERWPVVAQGSLPVGVCLPAKKKGRYHGSHHSTAKQRHGHAWLSELGFLSPAVARRSAQLQACSSQLQACLCVALNTSNPSRIPSGPFNHIQPSSCNFN